MKYFCAAIIAALLAGSTVSPFATGAANAQQVFKRMPDTKGMDRNTIILVDDGSCGKGKIKEVNTGSRKFNIPLTSKCIPRP